MSCQRAVYQWTEVVTTHMPHLSKPQAAGLAVWRLGMVLARSCALTAVSLFLAQGLDRKANTVRQQLREWCYEAQAKRGKPRQELAVESCFTPVLAWVLSWWEGNQLALAVDATTLGQRVVGLVVSVRYRGCAIPVAWTVLPATAPQAGWGEWLRMLRQGRAVVPRRFFVIVLADRGLYARWLFQRSVRLGWHPLLRINTGGTFRPAASGHYQPLRSLVPQPGTQWVGQGTAFQGPRRRLNCTLLARWEAGYTDPWLLLTDLAPSVGEACWYGLRAWIEQGFKITKRGGWQWQRTRLSDPQRAAGCGWPSRWPPCGCSVSGGWRRRRFRPARCCRWRAPTVRRPGHGGRRNYAWPVSFARAGSPSWSRSAISAASRWGASCRSRGRRPFNLTH
jgi:hypothetical protein